MESFAQRRLASGLRTVPKNRSQAGFSMVEVLVAVMVLSVGVLGAVGMQAASMQSNKEARNQAAAGSLARELAEKMRGNHTVAIQTTAAANPYLLDVTLTTPGALTQPTPNCVTAACATALNIANWDIYEWQARVAETFSSPKIKICMDQDPFDSSGNPKWECSDTGTVAVLKMAWNRPGEKSASGVAQLTSLTDTKPMLLVPLTAGSSE